MTKTRLFAATLFLFLSLFSIACSDDSPDPVAADTTEPVITIISPENNTTVTSPVTVAGTIVEAGELQRIEVNASGGPFQLTLPPIILEKGDEGFPTKTGDTYALTYIREIPDGFEGTYKIDIEAEDAAGNIGTATLNITVQ